MKEEWRSVLCRTYEVSSLGRVRRAKPDRMGRCSFKVLKPWPQRGGYLQVRLCIGHKTQTWLVHQLVATAFFGARRGLEVNHRDGNKTNNAIDNIEWVTSSENARHALRTGLRKYKAGGKYARVVPYAG